MMESIGVLRARDLLVEPIASADANALVRRVHYSHKHVRNSQLHLGVFLGGQLEGAMSFGPSLDKRKIQKLVRDTPWNGFLELNRLAFTERLPRNSESRALGVAMRMIKRNYPHIQWIVSFADACQCGDGAIYRAAGFVLTLVRKNAYVVMSPEGVICHKLSQLTGVDSLKHLAKTGGAASPRGRPLDGFQLRYMHFLDPTARARLTVPEVPYSAIAAAGAGMYRGEKVLRGKQAMAGIDGAPRPRRPLRHSGEAASTPTLQQQK